jgi:exodeoxyribonuclease VII small subunit
MEENLTYDQAYQEIKKIAEALNTETISVDVLAERVKRGAFLIKLCQTKLKNTEDEVNSILKQMEESNK